MVNVQRWSALGVGLCAALVLVAGCKSGGGIGGVGAAQNPPAASGQHGGGSGSTGSGSGGGQGSGGGSGSGGGTNCQFSNLTSCLMPKPDNATTPSGDWTKDGAMSQADYAKWFSDQASTQSQIVDELKQDGFTSAAHRHWQGTHDVTGEVVLMGFSSTSGATEWIDADNKSFENDSTINKESSQLVPGVWMFDYLTANNDGTYSTVAIGRFGTVVMEFYAYSNNKQDPLAENQLASWAAVQAGILKRAAT